MPAAVKSAKPVAHPAVDAYIAQAAPFAQPILRHLREVFHAGAPEAVEEMKWSRPFFVYRGVILGHVSAFKRHCSVGLWGKEIAERLRADGIDSSEGMGTFGKITSVEELPARAKLVGYVREAARAIAEGERTVSFTRPRVAKPKMVEMPPALAEALGRDKAASKAFETMSPSCRKEYCQWIAEAKREETRDRRVVTALQWIAEGKSRNWKYEQS